MEKINKLHDLGMINAMELQSNHNFTDRRSPIRRDRSSEASIQSCTVTVHLPQTTFWLMNQFATDDCIQGVRTSNKGVAQETG